MSIILPSYNEEPILESSTIKLLAHMDNLHVNCEVILSIDNSTDHSKKIAARLMNRYPNVRYVYSRERLGKGGGIENGFKASKGDLLLFMDVDLATDLNAINTALKKTDCDIVIGSRYLKKSLIKRNFFRLIASKSYILLTRILLNLGASDPQCGFKLFKKKVAEDLIRETRNKDWLWDIEILMRAKRKKYKISEIPIKWSERSRSKINFLQMISILIKLLKLSCKVLLNYQDFEVQQSQVN